jgi:hypothetical protein
MRQVRTSENTEVPACLALHHAGNPRERARSLASALHRVQVMQHAGARPRSRSVASLLPKKKKRWKGYCFRAGHQFRATRVSRKPYPNPKKPPPLLSSDADTNWPRAPGY